MVLLLHVLISFLSIAYPLYAFLNPTKKRLRITFGLVLLTFISGFYLIFTQPAHMVETCVIGLFYLGFVVLGNFSAQKKLAKNEARF